MAKRFTSTDKYKNKFFRTLPGPYKLFWDYLYHDCDHAGVWIVNFEIAQMYLGSDMLVDEEIALKLFNYKKQRILTINDGEKWVILPFIKIQYGILNPANRVHSSVLKTLKMYNIGSFETLPLTEEHINAKENEKKDNSPFTIIFEYWNNANIVTHRCFTNQMKSKINAKLNDYSVEEICDTIENYSAILRDNRYFFKYKWTLIDFFQRGFDKFFNKETACANYIISKKLSPKSQPVNPSFKKAKVEMKPKE